MLPVAVALGLTASAQTADIDPTANQNRVRPAAPAVHVSPSQNVDVAPVAGSGQMPAQQAGVPVVTGTTANQAAEVVVGGQAGSAKAFGYYYNNGEFVTGIGNGAGGANTSVITNGTLFGYGNQLTAGNRIADDFPVAGGTTVTLDTLTWRAYQTGAPTTGTITDINVNLWDTDPTLAGTPSQTGPTNSFVSQVWSGAYRVSSTNLTGSLRAIIDVTGDMTWAGPLDAGTYWVDAVLAGSLTSGPWAPPVVPETLGNGMQSIAGATFVDVGDDFPFELTGNSFSSGVCYNNGPFVTGIGNGAGGANTSVITNGTLFGYGNQLTAGNRCADDFPVPAGKTLLPESLVWRAYQTGAPTTGTITDINVNLWDTDPTLAGTPSQTGPANSFVSQVWSGAYRVSSTNLTGSLRAIIDVTGDMSWATSLETGTYWVDVVLGGSLTSGPWAPPVVPETLGNGMQSIAGATFVDVGDDFPFDICGDTIFAGCGWANGEFVTGIGNGAGGANTSVITNGTLFGYGNQLTAGNRIADDFDVAAGAVWFLDELTWRAYQTGAPTTGTITDINVNLWDTDPTLAGTPSQTGPANSFVSQVWSGAYRVSSTNLTGSFRAIIDVTGDMTWAAPVTGGKYWVDTVLAGSLTSGPWAPPVVPETFGNGMQSIAGATFVDVGDDFPFDLSATCDNGPVVYCEGKVNSCSVIPAISAPTGITSQGASGVGTYDVTLGPVPAGNFGLMFYTTDGKMTPITNVYGTLCININSGLFRVLPVAKSTGTGCDGAFAIDFGNFLATQTVDAKLTAAGLALSGGEVVDAHIWYRDPPNPGTANLSNAIRFIVLP